MTASNTLHTPVEQEDPRILVERCIDLLYEINGLCDVLMSTTDFDFNGKKTVEIPARSFCTLTSVLYQRSKAALECLEPVTKAVYTALQPPPVPRVDPAAVVVDADALAVVH